MCEMSAGAERRPVKENLSGDCTAEEGKILPAYPLAITKSHGDETVDIVTIHALKKYFGQGPGQVKALDGVNLSIEKGKFTAIVGASGSGKTTLLNMIAGLYRPTEGKVVVDGVDLARLTEDQLTIFRRRKVGFVFQEYNLVPELTVRENILFPLLLDGSRPDGVFFSRIVALLGLEDKLNAFPHMLSGGGAQCAAIARALITRPSIILADEPTGSLDAKNGQNVAGLLKMTAESFHQSLIMITHHPEIAQLAHRLVRLRDGRIVDGKEKEENPLSPA